MAARQFSPEIKKALALYREHFKKGYPIFERTLGSDEKDISEIYRRIREEDPQPPLTLEELACCY